MIDVDQIRAEIARAKDQWVAELRVREAAPDLLAALKAMMSDRFNGPDSHAIWKQAEAAILKAEGRQP